MWAWTQATAVLQAQAQDTTTHRGSRVLGSRFKVSGSRLLDPWGSSSRVSLLSSCTDSFKHSMSWDMVLWGLAWELRLWGLRMWGLRL